MDFSQNEIIIPMKVDEFYEMIEKAEEDIKLGRVFSQEEVEKDFI
jgi:hypothetical protein